MAVEAVRIDERRTSSAFRTLSLPEARALLLYGIERRRPVQLVVGRAGSGKSRLLGALSRTAIEGADLVLLRELPGSLEETTALLARRFGVHDVTGESPLERLARLAEVLAERRRRGRLVALLLDDAHLLTADALFDLRLLAGTDAGGGALLPIVMAGRPELATIVDGPALEPLRLALSTRIELCRPLAVMDVAEPSEAEAEPEPRGGRWWMLAGAPVVITLAALALSLRGPGVSRPPLAVPVPVPRAVPAPQADAPPPQAPPAVMPPPDLRAGSVTPDAARAVVAELAEALAARDLRRLSHLLARDSRQNGVRGRQAILDSYAYRFARLDVPISIDAPSRITLRNEAALVEAPFAAAYRDAAGDVGRVGGTLLLRVVLHGGRAVVDSLDWAFVGDAAESAGEPSAAAPVDPAA